MNRTSSRDRLLLAFADIASYGILARPAVDADPAVARRAVADEAQERVPFAVDDWVFWLAADDRRSFDGNGTLVGRLGLHVGQRAMVEVVEPALRRVGLPVDAFRFTW